MGDGDNLPPPSPRLAGALSHDRPSRAGLLETRQEGVTPMQHFPILDLAHTGLDFIRLDCITHLSQTEDESGNPIVELYFLGGHREVYGAEAAQPIVTWF